MSGDRIDRLIGEAEQELDGRPAVGDVEVVRSGSARPGRRRRQRPDGSDHLQQGDEHANTRADWRERGYDAEYDRNRRLVLREETVCHICGQPVDKTLSGRDRMGPTLDHLVPRARGGTNARSNLRLAHLSCNSAKRAGVQAGRRRRPPERHPGIVD